MSEHVEDLEELLRRYCEFDLAADAVPRVSLARALGGLGDPIGVLAYLAGLGVMILTLDDLLSYVADRDEDEVHCFRVEEGVAVTIPGPGGWVVFTA
jgi:hypothetical protein